jgi:hypothetical protein
MPRSVRHDIRLPAAFGALALAVVIGLLLLGGERAGAAKGITLGAAKPAPASCPEDCLVEANVTGFQKSIGSVKNPFVAPSDGRIVAWSIKLGEPEQQDIKFFNQSFGGSQARISILKPTRSKSGKRLYKLTRKSPVVSLRNFFGEITTFGLTKELPIREGQIVALTTPTWMPAFAANQGNSTKWQASRVPTGPNGCFTKDGASNVNAGEAQLQKGSQVPYRCTYKGSRLLYSARFIPAKASG